MSIATLCSTGKKENTNSELYINIINIPNQSSPTGLPTRIMFLSNIEILNYNDLIRVLDLYADYNQHVILVGGEYVYGSNRYGVVDMYMHNYILYLTYRNDTQVGTLVVATMQNPPSDWTYVNIRL